MAKSYEQWQVERAPITVEEHRFRREQAARGPETLSLEEYRARREFENTQRLRAAELSNGRPDPNYRGDPVPFVAGPIEDIPDPLGTPRGPEGLTAVDLKSLREDRSPENQLRVLERWAGFESDPSNDDPMGGFR